MIDSRPDEWIAFDQVVKRQSHSIEGEISVDPTVSFISIEEEKARREGTNTTMTSNPDDGSKIM